MITQTTKQLIRLREDIPTRELADKIGTSAEMIRRWTRGEAQPRIDRVETINQLCEELGISVAPSQANPFGEEQ